MSTDLKSRSKAYTLLRVGRGMGKVALVIGTGYNGPALELNSEDITRYFETGNFDQIRDALGLLDETMERLQIDLGQFALTAGNGMEDY